MSSSSAKRFWKVTSVIADERGYAISLDEREVKTPMGLPFIVKTETLASVIRKEWDDQVEHIDPNSMPIYKFAVTSLDRVSTQRSAVVDELSAYGASDLLCYREDRDLKLAEYQDQVWQPFLDWAAEMFSVNFVVSKGIMPGDQDQESISKLRDAVDKFDDYQLSGLHTLVTVSGSLVLGLAAAYNQSPLDDIIKASFLDDLWQQDKWGYDEEVAVRLKNHRKLIEDAHHYLQLLS